MQPPVGLTLNQKRGFGSRPSSANPHGVAVVGARMSNFHPSVESSKVASSPRVGMQDALVTNLKQQVACLETEVKYLKEKLSNAKEEGARGTPTELSRPPTGRSVGSLGSMVSASEALSHRAQELEEEVMALRKRYAEREQQHAMEIAAIKAGEGVSGLTSANNVAGRFKSELEKREHQNRLEVSSMRDLHAQEVVMLQKTVERLQRELQYAVGNTTSNSSCCGSDGGMPSTTRRTLADELVAFKSQLRAMTEENICLKRQHDDVMSVLTNEQQQRRTLEAANVDLKKQCEALGGELKLKLESKIESLEAKAKEAHASEVSKHYEMERARAAETKLKEDLSSAIKDKLDAEEKMNRVTEEKASTQAKLAKVEETLTDATGERDYYRLQHDRLLTEHKLAETKIKQLEAKAEADRHSIQLLEKQYCGTLDEIDAMRRQHVAKEDSYRELDDTDNATRRQNYVLKQDCERLREKLNLLEEDNEFMRKRYESVRHLADQSAAEGQIRNALGRLGKTKEELQNLLQTQMRLANELSSAMCDIPDLATVAGAIHHSDMSAANPHNTSSAPSPRATHEAPAVAAAAQVSTINKIREELNKVTSKIQAEEDRLAPLLSSTLETSPLGDLYPPTNQPPRSPEAEHSGKLLGTPPNTSVPPLPAPQHPQAQAQYYTPYYPSTYTPGYLPSSAYAAQVAPPSYPLYNSALPLQQPVAAHPTTTPDSATSRPATISESRVYSAVNGA